MIGQEMKFLLAFVIFIIGLNKINAECRIILEPDSPIFVPYTGNELLRFLPKQVIFGQYNTLVAVCPSGFKHPAVDAKTIFLKCVNGEIEIHTTKSIPPLTSSLQCLSTEKAEIFQGIAENCQNEFYMITLNGRTRSLKFAEVCFDLENMRIDFLHYVAKNVGKRISYRQFYDNEYLQNFTKTVAPSEIFTIDESRTEALIENIIGSDSKFLKFKYEEFYPKNTLYGYGHNYEPLQHARTFNRFLGWTNFIEGNWKLFRNLLEIRSQEVTYHVYLGTSDVVVVPSHDDTNILKKLHLKEDNMMTTVPKYVWVYLESIETHSDSEDFVVIGVNSPYFQFFPKNETIFCNDICGEIDWFSSLEKFRKISALGYMFCCHKEDVQNYLDGFPKYIEN